MREVPGKRSPRERTLLHPDARRTSWSHQGARTGKAGLVPVAAGQGPQPYVRTTLAFLKRPQLVPWGPLGQGEAPSPAGSHSSGLAGDGSLKSKEFKGTGKRQRLQRCVESAVRAFLEILSILPPPPSFSRGKNKYRHPRSCQRDGCVPRQREKLCPEAELDNQTKPPCQ